MIEKHKAIRNTAFTRAPSTSALAHPKVFLDHFFGDICKKVDLELSKRIEDLKLFITNDEQILDQDSRHK